MWVTVKEEHVCLAEHEDGGTGHSFSDLCHSGDGKPDPTTQTEEQVKRRTLNSFF